MPTLSRNADSASEGPTRVFVGRERELSELTAGLHDTVGGRGRLFFLVGDPGIGKTRLAEELAHAARGVARVLWGRCIEGGDGPAFGPWIQVLRALRSTVDAKVFAAQSHAGSPLVQILPELSDPADSAPPHSSAEATDARLPLFDAVTNVLRATAVDQPLVLLLDDLHDADQPSLQLLKFVARALVDMRILIVATYREIEVTNDAERATVISAAARYGRRLPLSGLSADDVERLIRGSFSNAATTALCTSVHRTTEGNPFFVDEIVRLLVAENDSRLPADLPEGGLRIPHGVRDAIRERLRPLSPPVRSLLDAAAVVGRAFDLAGLIKLSDAPRDELPVLLHDAQARGLIRPDDSLGGYLFAHALIRETIYGDLAPARRIDLHRRVGELLEERYAPDPTPHLDELAHHFEQAAVVDSAGKAVDYLERAGRRAMEMLAYEEAAQRLRRALQALALRDRTDRLREIDLLLATGEALARVGNTDSAEETFRRAAAVAREANQSLSFARAALGFGGTSFGVPRGSVSDRTLVDLLEEALRLLPPGEESGRASSVDTLRARLMARLGVELYFSDSASRRTQLGEEAMSLARRSGDAATLAYVANARHFTLWDSPDAALRLKVANEAIAAAERAGDRDMVSRGHFWRMMDLLEVGDAPAWEREIDVFTTIADELRQPRYRSLAATLHANRALWQGRFAEVETHAQQALALAEGLEDRQALISAGLQNFAVQRLLGRSEEVEPLIRGWVAQTPTQPATRIALALVMADLGRTEECRSEFEQVARRDFIDMAKLNQLTSMVPWLTEICVHLGDVPRAEQLYQRLKPFEARVISFGHRLCFGPASRYLGLLASLLGSHATAIRHFEDAIDRARRMKGIPYLALTQFELARFLHQDAKQEGQRAQQLAAEAEHSANELGMAALARHARELGEEIGRGAAPDHEPQAGRAVASGGGDPLVVEGAGTPARVVPLARKRVERPHLTAVPRRADASPAIPGNATSPPANEKPDSPNTYLFRLEGEFWSIGSGGSTSRLKDSLGLRYLARLLAEPGRELHVTQLVDGGRAPAEVRVSSDDLKDLSVRGRSTADPAGERFDAQARAAYRDRLDGLREQLEEAERFNDLERAARLREEAEFLASELGAGLGQRGGRTSVNTERARVSVTRVIKAALQRIAATDATVGRYLETTVKTGTYCSYRPDPRIPVEWRLS